MWKGSGREYRVGVRVTEPAADAQRDLLSSGLSYILTTSDDKKVIIKSRHGEDEMSWLTSLHKDHFAGAIIILLGAAAVFFAEPLRLGTLLDMGPGYFPTALGVILVLVGIAIAAGGGKPSRPSVLPDFPGEPDDVEAAAHAAAHEGIAKPELRGWSCILGAFVAFIFLFKYAGAVPAVTGLAALSALAERKNTWLSVAGLVLFANFLLVVVFWWILNMPMRLFWWN